MQRTSSSCPSSIRKHAPHSISHIRIVLSDEPLTTILSRYCKQAIPRLCPSNVRTNSQVVVSYKTYRNSILIERNGFFTYPNFNCSISTSTNNIFLIKINHINCCSMSNKYTSNSYISW